MRRFLLPVVVVVLAFAVSGCGARADVGRMAAVQEIAAGDKLLATKDYDGAYDRYVKAANECTSYPLYDQACSKATTALTEKVGKASLAEQVTGFKGLLEGLPYRVMPLPAHIWLSDALRMNAEATVARGKAVAADDKKLLGAPAKKPAAKKPVPKKAPAKKPSAKPALAKKPAAAPATTAPVVATTPVTAAVATASAAATAPPLAVLSAAELASISQALPGLGQPPEMQKLYASLAEISAAADGCERARAGLSPKRPMTLAQRRTLAAADARLTRALQSVHSLLASL